MTNQATPKFFIMRLSKKARGAAGVIAISFLASLLANYRAAAQLPPVRTLPVAPQTSERIASPPVAEPTLTRARSLIDSGLTSDAEANVRDYLGAHPDSADAHFLLGYILFREIQQPGHLAISGQKSLADTAASRPGKARESLAEFTEGARYRPPSAADLKIVALDYILLGDYPDADKWLTKMLGWTPTDSEGWYYLGRTKYSENRFDESVHAFQQALKLDPKNVKTEDNLGLAYAGLGRTDEAIAAYLTAISWQKDAELQGAAQRDTTGKDGMQDIALKNAGPFIDIGSLFLDQNRTTEAIPYLNQAVEISSRDAKAHELLGKAYSRLDQLPQAQSELEQAIELAPQNPNLPCMLGSLYRKQGQTDKAKTQLDRCAALNGTHSSSEIPRP